jgi:hypothetical protein
MKRLPRTGFFVFRNAHGVFPWPAEGCLASAAWIGASYVSLNQTNSPSDSCVSAPSLAQNIRATIDLKLMTDRAVHDQHDGWPACRGLQCVEI